MLTHHDTLAKQHHRTRPALLGANRRFRAMVIVNPYLASNTNPTPYTSAVRGLHHPRLEAADPLESELDSTANHLNEKSKSKSKPGI